MFRRQNFLCQEGGQTRRKKNSHRGGQQTGILQTPSASTTSTTTIPLSRRGRRKSLISSLLLFLWQSMPVSFASSLCLCSKLPGSCKTALLLFWLFLDWSGASCCCSCITACPFGPERGHSLLVAAFKIRCSYWGRYTAVMGRIRTWVLRYF